MMAPGAEPTHVVRQPTAAPVVHTMARCCSAQDNMDDMSEMLGSSDTYERTDDATVAKLTPLPLPVSVQQLGSLQHWRAADNDGRK